MNFATTVNMSHGMPEVCEPLFEKTPINCFNYFKTFHDGKFITLTSNLPWLEHYFNKKHYLYSSFRDKIENYQVGYRLTQNFNRSSPIVKDALDAYKIGPGIVLIKPGKIFCEFFLFCSDPFYKSSHDFFLNNLDMLEKFTFYFKDKARQLVDKSEKKKLILPPIKKTSDHKNPEKPEIAFGTKRYYIDDKTYITHREAEVIRWLGRGKNCEEIAMIFGRSTRTIEAHVRNIKDKLNIYKPAELILYAKEKNII